MDNLRGALLMILAMAGFAGEDGFVKAVLGRGMPMGQVLVYLGLAGGLAFALLAARSRRCWISRDFFHPAVLLRNGAEIVGTASYVTALTLIPLSLAGALLQAMPLFVILGAILFLGERVGWRRWAAIAAGLVGVLMILRPGFEGFDPNALWAVSAAIGLAARDLATRRVPATAHPLQLSSWAFLMVAAVGAVMLAFTGGAVRPDPTVLAMLAAALAIGMVGYYALTLAVQTGEIGYVTPFRYTRLVFALVVGWAVFSERPDAMTLIGAAIVVGSGVYTLWRERRIARRYPSRSGRSTITTPSASNTTPPTRCDSRE